ncbi:hypothetical protein CEXT_789591 [Caerostris extrusa]|uniref:Uncharacterized protein n=1 Tax=Caerostris extrusa TaxID=172846 RepID=A0AAV4WCU5_CAEEX|nr:hypothetical protein CEXT_789591 [Caerostris extrusa]
MPSRRKKQRIPVFMIPDHRLDKPSPDIAPYSRWLPIGDGGGGEINIIFPDAKHGDFIGSVESLTLCSPLNLTLIECLPGGVDREFLCSLTPDHGLDKPSPDSPKKRGDSKRIPLDCSGGVFTQSSADKEAGPGLGPFSNAVFAFMWTITKILRQMYAIRRFQERRNRIPVFPDSDHRLDKPSPDICAVQPMASYWQ